MRKSSSLLSHIGVLLCSDTNHSRFVLYVRSLYRAGLTVVKPTHICHVDHTDLRSEQVHFKGLFPVGSQLCGEGKQSNFRIRLLISKHGLLLDQVLTLVAISPRGSHQGQSIRYSDPGSWCCLWPPLSISPRIHTHLT